MADEPLNQQSQRLPKDRRKWGWVAILSGALLLVGALLVRAYLWLRQSGAMVNVDGESAHRAAVYRCHNGQLLLWLGEPWAGRPYVILPSERLVLDADVSNAFLRTAWFVLSRYTYPSTHALVLRYPNAKLEVDPRVVFDPRSVEFTVGIGPQRSRRVRVELPIRHSRDSATISGSWVR
jgi:hypothetical protein